MSITRCLPGAVLFAAAVPAQLTVTDGNMQVALGAPSSVSQAPLPFALRADALATDHGREHGWYFRIVGDRREYALRRLGAVVVGNPTPDHGDRDFANLDNRGLLKASHDLDIYDAGPASGVCTSRLTLMNISSAPVTVNVYCYTDLDVADTFGDDVVTGTAQSHFVTDASGVQIEVRALGSDLAAAVPYPGIRNLLLDTAADNLPATLAPFVGDYTGAFQWQNRTLQPFEVRSFQVLFAVDTVAAAAPLVELYGTGNGSHFEIQTPTLPLQDNTQPRSLVIQMKGALPGAEQRTIVGLSPWVPQPFISGIDLWVLPTSVFGVYAGLTSATGTAQEVFTIPPAPYFAGISAYFQVFYVDPAAPNQFAYFSPGLHVRIGKL
ncbi:MAG: hypothetical protein WAT39_16420 [Planctomycetota bacterium]